VKKKKKKKRSGSASQASPKQGTPKSFNNPFGDLSLPSPAQEEAPAVATKPQKPEKRTADVATPSDDKAEIDPLEASFFLNAMSHVKRVEKVERHIPEQRALEVAAREDALALVELRAMMESQDTWQVEENDDFVRGRSSGVNDKLMSQLARGEFPPGRTLDLHGMTKPEAHLELRRLIASSRRDAIRSVLVVTGRGHNSPDGQSVLKQALPSWLSKSPLSSHVLAFSTAPKHLGSTGAFLILLKRKS